MIELRQHIGRELFRAGEKTAQRFDEIVCDHRVIGMSFRYENKIHWHIPKKDIPKSIIREAVQLCQKRNENR